MKELLYIKIDKYVEIDKEKVIVKDVSKIYCTNDDVINKVYNISLYKTVEQKQTRIIMSALWIIEQINKEIPNIEIQNIGESDVLIKIKSTTKTHKLMEALKIIVVWALLFMGSAFAIMSFSNDVSVEKLFSQIYEKVIGEKSNGFTVIEITYSIGIFIGIIVFYNHFGKRKISKDPTPMEVQMRTYENDVNQTLIDGAGRKEDNVDVR